MNTTLVLLESVLKRKIVLYLTTINNLGEEKEEILKLARDKFIACIGEQDIKVSLVDKYPTREEWQLGIFYVVKNGKAIYYKDKIGKIINFKEK